MNKHGIKIDLVQSGDLGAFSFAQLLISLTTSLTLLAMATVITDYIALYFLPDKEKYDEAKYEWTEDFSDMREASRDRKRRTKGLGELSEVRCWECANSGCVRSNSLLDLRSLELMRATTGSLTRRNT